MQRACNFGESDPISEMAIVDTFTKLIFGEEEQYSSRELKIIKAFRAVDSNVFLDNHRDMGEYLRALGVREMIHLVSLVQEQLLEGVETAAGKVAQMLPDSAHHQVMNRRAH